MSVIVMEPLVIRGRAPGRAAAPEAIEMEPLVIRGRPLTNRAAGALREASADAGRVAFGGFGYIRTAEDDAQVRAYARAAARRGSGPATPAPAMPDAGPAVDRAAFGRAAYERTAEDDAQAASYVAADARPTAAPAGPEAIGSPDAAPAVGLPAADAGGGGETPDGTPDAVSVATPDAGVRAGAAPNLAGIDTPGALVAAARATADGLPHPDVPRAPLDRAFAPLVTAAAARARRPIPRGGGGSYPPPRPVEPIEIDPVPTATATLSSALNDRLPELNLPAIRAMPDGTVPTLPAVRGVDTANELAVEVDVDSPAADAADVNAAEASRRTRATAPAPDPAAAAPAPVPVSPPVLVDFRRPPPPPLPQAEAALENAQITRVLALIAQSVETRTQTLVDDLRDRAFPPHKLANYYLDVTDPMKETIRTGLTAKLAELREAAGITVETLDAAVRARQAEIDEHRTHVATAAELEVDRTATTLTREAERENGRAEAQRLRDQARQVARYRQALHSRDPTLVEELVTARLGYIDADVGRGEVAIDAAKARRLELLGLYDTAYRTAYRTADDAFQHPAGRGPRAPPNVGDRLWYDVATDELATAMTRLNTQTENDAATLANSVRDAGLAAKAAVRTWSDTRLRRTLSDDERVARTTRDIDATNTAVNNARAQATRDATRARLVGEIRFAAATALRTMDDADSVSREHMITLNDEQLRDGRAFLATGDAGDPMSAVANNLVRTYARENLADKPAEIQTAVYAKVAATTAEAGEQGDIYFPGGGGELESRVNKLWDAFEVWHGTAEEDAITQLQGLDSHASALLNRAYYLIKGESLQWRIGDEMSGSEYDRAMGLARGDREGRQMYARGEIAESHGWFSNDSSRALDAVRNLPPGEAEAVVNDTDTAAHLRAVLDGSRWVDARGSVTDDRGMRELDILTQLNRPTEATDPADAARRRDLQARADAIEFDRAVRRGTGSSAPSTEAVMDRIRASVTASAPDTWSDAEIDNEVRRRVRAMENAYEAEFGSELPSGGVSALRTAVARYSYGTSLDIRQALLDVDRSRERAGRLQRTTEGLYTSDSEMNTELTRTYDQALAEVRRNRSRREAVEARARALMEADGITAGGRTPAASEIAAYRQEAEEEAARALSGEWMRGTSAAFADRYGRRWGGGDDPLRDMITSETQFAGETEALARYAGGGGLTAAQSVEIGQAGWGMDRSMVLAGIGNRTTQQLTRISADYARNTGGRDVDGRVVGGRDMLADLRSETGSWTDETPDTRLERDAFDIREAMRGVPTTPQQTYDAAQRRFAYERDVYFGGSSGRPAGLAPQFAALQRQMDRADARMRELEAATASGDTAAARRLEAGLDAARASVAVSADAYRHAVDEHVEGVATKVAIAVALAVVVIAAAVTTVLTGGLAAPAWVAVATAVGASVAATAASMAVKQSMLGSAYGQNAFRTDLVIGVVDAIVSALTAGLGDKLLRLRSLGQLAGARTAAARTLAMRAIAAERATRPVLARMAAFGAEQIAQSVPTALVGAALNRDTWRGDPLRNVASAGGMAALTGIGMGAVMHHAMPHVTGAVGSVIETGRMLVGGSGAHISADSVTLASSRRAAASGDVEGAANRGSWGERLAARREYLRANPGATDADFDVALMMGGIDTRAQAASVRDALPDLRAHLVSGLSGADAELAAHARIEVLGDAEFFARTGSESNGYAATLNVNGEPVVVVREGAPLTRLAEEGRHIAQFFDPANTSRLALIEEGRLANYASLSVPERIEAWNAKIDLELDVQRRAIPELRARLNDPNLSVERANDLGRMLTEAETALEVLSGRRAHLAGLDAVTVARMASGEVPEPRWLADEPRLFAKATGPPPPPPATVPETWTEGGRTFIAEPHFMDGSRKSRWVGVYSGGELVEVVLQRRDGANWRLSGRVGRDRGGVAEFAARMEHALAATADESATVQVRQLNGQTGTGAGLDDLWFRFETRANGTIDCRTQVYEAKNYDGQVSSFTAVDDNYRTNMTRARDRLQAVLKAGSWDEVGMTRAQVEAAIRSIDAGQVDVIIQTTASTTVNPDHMTDLQRRLRRRTGPGGGSGVRVTHDPTPIGEGAMMDAEELWLRTERFRRMGYQAPDNVLFKDLSNTPRGQTPESVDLAEAVVAARSQPGSPIVGTPRWAPGRTHLVDKAGPFLAVRVERPTGTGAFDATARARALLAAAEAGVTPKGGSSVAPVRVVVAWDPELTTSQAREVRRALASIAAAEGRTAAASKIIWPAVAGTTP